MSEREREDRSETTRRERRRRDDTTAQSSNQLAISPEVQARLKAEGRQPRWVNDQKNRIHSLTVMDDYDKVEGVAPVPVGTEKDGTPILAHLLSKPIEFVEEDRSKAESKRKGTESGLLRGKLPSSPGGESVPIQGSQGAEMYVAAGSKLGRGVNEVLE